jgi:hypothetical protein
VVSATSQQRVRGCNALCCHHTTNQKNWLSKEGGLGCLDTLDLARTDASVREQVRWRETHWALEIYFIRQPTDDSRRKDTNRPGFGLENACNNTKTCTILGVSVDGRICLLLGFLAANVDVDQQRHHCNETKRRDCRS